MFSEVFCPTYQNLPVNPLKTSAYQSKKLILKTTNIKHSYTYIVRLYMHQACELVRVMYALRYRSGAAV